MNWLAPVQEFEDVVSALLAEFEVTKMILTIESCYLLSPLQDFEEVASASLAVYEVTELMADECPDADAVGAEQLSSLAGQLTAAHERLQELLTLAQQEANNEGVKEEQ
jgi:hypothetical protein